MIDRHWEAMVAREAPRIALAEAMCAAGLDPACEGCRVEHRTGGKYFVAHTCARVRSVLVGRKR